MIKIVEQIRFELFYGELVHIIVSETVWKTNTETRAMDPLMVNVAVVH